MIWAILNTVVGLLFIVLGLANDPARDAAYKKKIKISFVVLGVASICLTWVQTRQQDIAEAKHTLEHMVEQASLEGKLNSTQDTLDKTQSKLDASLINEGSMKTSLTIIADKQSKTHGCVDAEMIAVAKAALSEESAEENQAMLDNATELNAKFYEAWQHYDHRFFLIHHHRDDGTPEVRKQIAEEEAASIRDYNIELIPILGEAKMLRTKILGKIGGETDEDKQWDESISSQDNAQTAGQGFASYLLKLATKLKNGAHAPKPATP